MKLDHHLIPYKKINSTWLNELNVGPETIKPLEESIGGKLHDISIDEFFNLTPKPKSTKA